MQLCHKRTYVEMIDDSYAYFSASLAKYRRKNGILRLSAHSSSIVITVRMIRNRFAFTQEAWNNHAKQNRSTFSGVKRV